MYIVARFLSYLKHFFVKPRKPALPLRFDADWYYGTIHPHVKKFEETIWFGKGIAEQVRATKCRGQSGQAGKYNVLLWTGAGRTMWTIEDRQGNWASFVVAEKEDKPTMGLHDRSMEDDMLIYMLNEVIKTWKGVKDNPSVSVI